MDLSRHNNWKCQKKALGSVRTGTAMTDGLHVRHVWTSDEGCKFVAEARRHQCCRNATITSGKCEREKSKKWSSAVPVDAASELAARAEANRTARQAPWACLPKLESDKAFTWTGWRSSGDGTHVWWRPFLMSRLMPMWTISLCAQGAQDNMSVVVKFRSGCVRISQTRQSQLQAALPLVTQTVMHLGSKLKGSENKTTESNQAKTRDTPQTPKRSGPPCANDLPFHQSLDLVHLHVERARAPPHHKGESRMASSAQVLA